MLRLMTTRDEEGALRAVREMTRMYRKQVTSGFSQGEAVTRSQWNGEFQPEFCIQGKYHSKIQGASHVWLLTGRSGDQEPVERGVSARILHPGKIPL